MDYTVSIMGIPYDTGSWVALAAFRYRVDAVAYARRVSWDDFDRRKVRIEGDGETQYLRAGEWLLTVTKKVMEGAE